LTIQEAPGGSNQSPDPGPALAFFSNVRPTLASFTGEYSLTIQVDPACPLVSPSGKVREYNVTLSDAHPYGYLSVSTVNPTLVGDLWSSGLFRWNGDEFDVNCGSSETVDSARYCLWGQGRASAGGDGVISGDLAGGVDIGAATCRGVHRFVMRRKS
jgi:hypothetical protein